MESVSAMKLASRMLVETPTVEKTVLPSVESMRTRTALGRAAGGDDAHLEIGQPHVFQHRIEARERLAQGEVEGVDRAVALVGGDLHALIHGDFHIGLRVERAGVRAGEDVEIEHLEKGRAAAERFEDAQCQRAVRVLKGIALRFQRLDVFEDADGGLAFAGQFRGDFSKPRQERAAPTLR